MLCPGQRRLIQQQALHHHSVRKIHQPKLGMAIGTKWNTMEGKPPLQRLTVIMRSSIRLHRKSCRNSNDKVRKRGDPITVKRAAEIDYQILIGYKCSICSNHCPVAECGVNWRTKCQLTSSLRSIGSLRDVLLSLIHRIGCKIGGMSCIGKVQCRVRQRGGTMCNYRDIVVVCGGWK